MPIRCELGRITDLGTGARAISAGSDLYRQGDICSTYFVVLDGWIALSMLLDDGSCQILDFALPGSLLGFQPDGPMRHSARCLSWVRACALPRQKMNRLVEANPSLAFLLCQQITADAARAHDHLANVGLRGARERIAHLLLHQANPGLTQLLCEVLGGRVLDDPAAVADLADHCADPALHERVMRVKRNNKVALARVIRDQLGLVIDPRALFDVQIKRIHEYKRQLLNLIETVALYEAMRTDPAGEWVPRVKILAGKAAASCNKSRARRCEILSCWLPLRHGVFTQSA
jgi:CRP-like cAMP-binding protein